MVAEVSFCLGACRVETETEARGANRDAHRRYTAKATIGGKLTQVGSRLVDGVAKKLAENCFLKFNEHVSGTAE